MNKFKLSWHDLIILFLAIGIFVNYQIILSVDQNHQLSQNVPNTEFAMIIKDSEDPFWQSFKKGADKAAQMYQASLETTYLEARGQVKSEFDEKMLIDKSTIAKSDGIISFIGEPIGCEKWIDQAAEAGIPVITLENDVPNSKRASFVGYNAYRFGQEAGKKMAESLNGNGKIVIIMSRKGQEEQNAQNLKISGFLNEINQSPSLEVVEYIISDNDLYSAQNIVSKLINTDTPINGVFATNSVDTESFAQLLVDNNLVGKYQVVGSGNSDEILSAVRKGIVYASVYVNAYEMGYKTVETLAKIKKNESVPSYIDTTISVISGDSEPESQN